MSYLKNIIVLIAVFSATISTAGEKSSVYPIYSIENVTSYEVSQDTGTLFILEKNEAGILFSGRDILSGEITLSVQLEMPEAYFMNTVIVDDDVYVFVFNLQNPKLEKTETVSETDQERIKSLFRGTTTTEKSILDPAVLSQVLYPKYYKIDLVTTEVDSSDGQMSSSSSTETFIAAARDDVYSVFKKNEELAADVSGDFILNEKSALLFQDALDVLFPVGHFAEKHKAFYKNDDHWVFVRDESFGELTGIIVKVDGDGKVVTVGPDEKLAE